MKYRPHYSFARMSVMVLRYWYLLRSSWPRLLELAYWPTVQMIMWGFLQSYLVQHSGFFAQAGGILLGGVILWDILFRGQIGLSICFFEEMWSRNLGHLLVSPLQPMEFAGSLMLISLIRTVIGLFPATLLAIWFFGFSVYDLGLALIAFFFNLIIFGWALGLMVSGIVLRYGLGAESLAWAIIFVFLPLCGVYYPIDVLPEPIGLLAQLLPPTYVFEGMRALLMQGSFNATAMLTAALLNVFYLGGGCILFLTFLYMARRRGTLLHMGE
jgi:ABC-2 type transport system permease protein